MFRDNWLYYHIFFLLLIPVFSFFFIPKLMVSLFLYLMIVYPTNNSLDLSNNIFFFYMYIFPHAISEFHPIIFLVRSLRLQYLAYHISIVFISRDCLLTLSLYYILVRFFFSSPTLHFKRLDGGDPFTSQYTFTLAIWLESVLLVHFIMDLMMTD